MSARRESPARKRQMVLHGTAGVISLPDGDELLVSGEPVADGVVAVRLNNSGAFCWARERSAHWLHKVLKRADGDITVGDVRDLWPEAYQPYHRTGVDG